MLTGAGSFLGQRRATTVRALAKPEQRVGNGTVSHPRKLLRSGRYVPVVPRC